MKTETLILNTDISALATNSAEVGTSVWAEFIPAGTAITGRDGRSWVNDDPNAIVAAFAANGAGLPIDIEHATEIKGKAGEPAPAVGWIKALQAREGGTILLLLGYHVRSLAILNTQYSILNTQYSILNTLTRTDEF
ncbi:phage protease [Enterovibrio sp. ZSDZ42]|uniref:Phage protease n=1 Tax=Enterovibrio gelatinilyticus TaxID=2899819 RepID=A0ABT5R4B5_9GAMM|nr:phage protease [Enterovibrio sp. ZSDZ42]MDD1795110.1 phage protease [Enterovibrio sp. ZSDZ42]